MSNRPIKTYSGDKANYVVGGNELNEVIEHLNDLFVGKAMTTEEMRLLQHIVDHICSMSNENQLKLSQGQGAEVLVFDLSGN